MASVFIITTLEVLSSLDAVLQNDSFTAPKKCNPIKPAKNATFVKDIGGFESLSESLITDIFCFLLLMAIYSILSKKARDATVLRDVNSVDSDWIQLFYGDANAAQCAHHSEFNQAELPEHFEKHYQLYCLYIFLVNFLGMITRQGVCIGLRKRRFELLEQLQFLKRKKIIPKSPKIQKESKGYLFWLRAILKIRDEHVLTRCGIDAIRYLAFQRRILCFALFASFISIFVLIPVNFQGTLEETSNYFSRISMVNLHPNSVYLWVHPFFAVVYIVVCMALMWDLSSSSEVDIFESIDRRTLMITNIQKAKRRRRYIRSYFKSLYPTLVIEDIQFAYDVRKLMSLDYEKDCVESAIKWCENAILATGVRPTMKPVTCGFCYTHVCCCCCCNYFQKVDSLGFYTQRKNHIIEEMEEEIEKVLANPLGIAFVTFRMYQMVNMILVNDELLRLRRYRQAGVSDHRNTWILECSPTFRNIYWENLAVSKTTWYLNALVMNSLLFLFVFFLTTPNIVLSALGFYQTISVLTAEGSFVSEYVPTLTLLSISLVLPLLVAYSDMFMNYSTRSVQNLSMMIKAFTFLIVMVVILPCLELTSINAFLRSAATREEKLYRWECVFVPDNGLFFITYILASAFIGTSVQLIRVPELAAYCLLILLSRSRAEYIAVRKAVIWEFEFGIQYAYYLLNVAIIIIFCISAPVIAPFGLFYLSFKYLVDRYNMYFVYTPVKMSKAVHTTAMNILLFCFALQLLLLLIFTYIRSGINNLFLVYFFGFIFTVLLFLVQLYLPYFQCFHWLAYPHNKETMKEKLSIVARDLALLEEEETEEEVITSTELGSVSSETVVAEEDTLDLVEVYVPHVLRRALRCE